MFGVYCSIEEFSKYTLSLSIYLPCSGEQDVWLCVLENSPQVFLAECSACSQHLEIHQ